MRRLAIGLTTGVVLLAACQSGTPIAKQNCHQLAATERKLNHPVPINDPGFLKHSNDALDVAARVKALGGCPEEPDLVGVNG